MSISNGRAAHNWRRVSAAFPCPVCKRPDWCSVSTDGALAACRRIEPGSWRSKIDKAGAPVYLHRLTGAAPADLAPPLQLPGSATPRADAELLHRAYSALLGRLQLFKAHRDALRGRGLVDTEIDRRGYRTLAVQGRARLARDLREQLGDALLSVPGFVIKQGTDGSPYLTIAGAAGLLVPVRDPAGQVLALLVRRDDANDGRGKYSYLSSARTGGPGPGTPAHVPLGLTSPCPTCRLTEGALKADVAAALSALPTVGAAGLAWRPALDALAALGCRTVRLAFDADALDNPTVARVLAACRDALDAAGLAVEVERWDRADGKGIDDLLVAGKVPDLLTGETARAAIREALAAATAGEPLPPPDDLGRLPEVLAAGGAAALFGDRPLLQALARVADADPAAFAACRATLKGVVSLRDLDAALKPFRREQARALPAVLLAAAGYRVEAGCLCRVHDTADGGTALRPLCNFTARITEVVTRDDGAERTALFTVAGARADGRELPPVQIPAKDFDGLGWVTTAWHGEAVVYAGQGTRDHLRAAIELVSENRVRRTLFAHTGWRRIGDGWHYLHAGGAIGADGQQAEDVPVSLPEALAGFCLPVPLATISEQEARRLGPLGNAARQETAALADAVQASLGLRQLGPGRLIFPLLSAVYRAALGDTDFALHLAGPTGCYKSEVAALAQQHFGPDMDSRHLPAGWSSTGNALEALAFAAKDALLVVDDFCPSGSSADVQRYHKEADRLFRGQGNHAGRQRLRADANLRPARPPRGLVLSTGEETPRGQSLRARLLVLEVSPGDFGPAPPRPNPTLTACQQDAEGGRYAAALAGFLRWLAPQYDALRGRLRAEAAELRDRARARGQHARTPGIVADLALGLRYLLDFAQAVGALTELERADLWQQGWAALAEAAAAQAAQIGTAEPAAVFLRLLAAALAGGYAHVADVLGREPADPERWGWREETYYGGKAEPTALRYRPQGKRVGWLAANGSLYLEPEVSFAVAQDLAGDQGDALTVSPRTLRKRLRERGLLAATDARREVLTVRQTLEGQRREVLHLAADVFCPCAEPDQPDQPAENPGRNGRVAGRVQPDQSENPTSNPTTKPGQKHERNGQLVGLVGSDTEGEEERGEGNDPEPETGPWGDW